MPPITINIDLNHVEFKKSLYESLNLVIADAQWLLRNQPTTARCSTSDIENAIVILKVMRPE